MSKVNNLNEATSDKISEVSNKIKNRLHLLSDDLKQERDELRVKVHLAHSEVSDEWENLEKKWEHFNAKIKKVGHEANEASKEVWSATELLGAEIGEGYKRIRKSL